MEFEKEKKKVYKSRLLRLFPFLFSASLLPHLHTIALLSSLLTYHTRFRSIPLDPKSKKKNQHNEQ